MLQKLKAIDDRFVFTGARRRYVAFPLGGIGTGSVSLTGSGRLTDWSIRNRPDIHQFNGYSHFAIKAERDGKLLDARVLNGPYEGTPTGSPSTRKFDGYGFGANRNSMTGVPHFDDVTFIGRFPVAELEFHHRGFPGQVRMSAFSPFIPHNDRDSSMPAALFAVTVENDTDAPIDYTIASTLGNYGCDSGIHSFSRAGGLSTLHFTSADSERPPEQRGDLAITTDGGDVEHVDYHFRGQWFDSLSLYWREFARAGSLRERHYDKPRAAKNMFQQPEHGTLAVRVRVAPGESRQVRFALSWNYPLGSIYWFKRDQPGSPFYAGHAPTWKNYYATQWADSAATGGDAFRRWDELEAGTVAFRDSLYGSSLPSEIIDAVGGTLGILRTATVIRLEGGEVWAWEGQHEREGSCEGSCTHVWNYQQALSNLFPALERTLRETEFSYNQLPTGGLTFRQRLPLGSGFDIIGPCADGHFGAIVKAYREWKNFGDDAWLKRYWPQIRRAMEYAWSPENPDHWDPDKTGVLWGRQHHTLDMELFGPNSWLTTMYLAALKAAANMADAMGEGAFAGECRAMAEKGGAYVDRELFNGRYYAQKLDLADKSVLTPFDQGRKAGVLANSFMEAYWSDEYGEIKYQIGDGCLTDQILGQWHADVAGLGDLIAPDKARTALQSIFRENYRPSLRDHFNPCRVYAYEDEAGLLICTWPEGSTKPAVPAPYAEEVWTGLEYMIASHLIQRGLVEEGLTIVRAARARHDGARRNPWNDIECGSYYARSLSSYALVNAYTGLTFDQRKGEIGFRPARPGDGVYLWSAGRGWGEVVFKGGTITLIVKGGELAISRLLLPTLTGAVKVDGRAAEREGEAILLGNLRALQPGDRIVVGVLTRVAKLELKGVRKSFQAVEVIHGIDLAVDDGSFTVFVGPSGCGKSTLLRMIAGLEEVSGGEIHLDGVRCDHLIPSARGMAMVFQSYALYPHMSVRENLRFGLVCQKLPKAEIEMRIRRAAEILQIAHLLERKPAQLSGGQSQRVAIGRAIVKEPKAFLFDEPLSNLDAELRVKMRSEIVSLHRRLASTIVYVTHDQVEAMTMADRIVVLRDGVTEQIGTPIELYARPQNRFVAGFLGAPQMNMLAGIIRAAGPIGLEIEVDGGRGLVPASVAAPDQAIGAKCTVGIRPEHMLPADDGDLRATVEATEMVGADTLVYATLQSGERVIASLRGIHPVGEGSPLAFTVDQRFVHVFGADDRVLPPLRPWREDYIARFPSVASPLAGRRSEMAGRDARAG